MAPDPFEGNSPLTPEEQLDSDEVRNADGDEVVDPPEKWIDAGENETLDERLRDEVPDVTPDDIDPDDAEDGQSETVLKSDDDMDRLDPEQHGRSSGQVGGTPEDGESFFNVEK
jgi:hypothetical protein